MSLTAQVTKKSVLGDQPRINIITFSLVITDTEGTGFTQDFSCEYRAGENIINKISEIIEKMQTSINVYKNKQVIFNSAALNTAITSIQNGLTL